MQVTRSEWTRDDYGEYSIGVYGRHSAVRTGAYDVRLIGSGHGMVERFRDGELL